MKTHYYHRALEKISGSYFLLGPRGTGKTTWLKHQYPDAVWINLLEAELFQYYSARPQRLRELIEAYPEKKVVIIDEIQKIPELLPLIHSLIEEKRGLQFIMTGSSARKLKEEGVNLLGGRAEKRHMHPFVANELGDAFSVERALEIGMLPLVWGSDNPNSVLNAYTGLYLQEEVKGEGIVRSVGDFARFMEIISFSHASVINTNNIARECDVTRKTVDSYIQILIDLLLAFEVPVFTQRAKRKMIAHAKLYLFDSGVYRNLRPMGPLDSVEEILGGALEGLVAQHLRAWIDYQEKKHRLFFWRTQTGVEVDFIVYGPQGLWAIEVKNHDRVFPKDLKGLRAFCEDYPEATPLLLYRGKYRILQNGVMCIPCEEFLKQIHPENHQLLEPYSTG